jgi:hypothetical protein
VNGEKLAPGSVVPCGTERIGADENALFRPPERDLVPAAVRPNRAERKRAERLARDDVVRDAEPARQGFAAALVPVEELDDTGNLTGDTDPFLDAVGVDRIDYPDATVGNERVRAALEELVFDQPLESDVELAERDPHGGESTGTP